MWRRIIVEKPFGRDLASAQALNHAIHAVFDESQVYRIDHYLGKETAQNILFFRFANTIFEPVWNRRYVNNVQVTVSETVDVAHRAGYYDTAGVMRDMFQNHLSAAAGAGGDGGAQFVSTQMLFATKKPRCSRASDRLHLTDTVRGQYVVIEKPNVSLPVPRRPPLRR